MKKPLEDLAGRAAKLKTELGDIGQARSAFGDLSRAFVQLLAAAPPLRQGRHIFECPMAEGYQKWVQVSSEMANPYMGKKMLKCGSEATWIP
jgi:Cu(I)/Ag(I) efflux system membrane fusion protein